MIIILNFMESEIQYRCTPLPLLCRQAAEQVTGKMRIVFDNLANELEAQIAPNAELCMISVLDRLSINEDTIRTTLMALGSNLENLIWMDRCGHWRAHGIFVVRT